MIDFASDARAPGSSAALSGGALMAVTPARTAAEPVMPQRDLRPEVPDMEKDRRDAITAALNAATWPDEIEAVDLLEWRDIEIFEERMTVPVIKVRTPDPIDDDQSDGCKEQIEALIGDDFSIMWLFTHPTRQKTGETA